MRYLRQTEAVSIDEEVTDSVRDILGQVESEGDAAVRKLTETFDGVERETIKKAVESGMRP